MKIEIFNFISRNYCKKVFSFFLLVLSRNNNEIIKNIIKTYHRKCLVISHWSVVVSIGIRDVNLSNRLTTPLFNMVEEKRYAIVHWEDKLTSIIRLDDIKHPRKPIEEYRDGDYVVA